MRKSPIGRRGITAAASALALAAQAAPGQAAEETVADRLAAAPSLHLTNGVLSVTVLPPQGERRFYRGTRFDGSGVVSSLTYKGHEFYGPWFQRISPEVRDVSLDSPDMIVVGPNTAMMGPAEEFDSTGPLGFADAAPGSAFVKIGVGELRRPDAANYSGFRTYEVSDPGRWTVRSGRDRVTFTHTLASKATGYGYRYAKTLRLVPGQPRMLIEHVLRNTGARAIETTVYNHNFVTFGGSPTDEAVSVRTPFPISTSRPPDAAVAAVQGDTLVYKRAIGQRERVALPFEGYPAGQGSNAASVSNARLGTTVSFQGDRPLERMAIWSIRSVVAVEPFVRLVVPPGEEVRWSFAYTYSAEGER